MGKYLPSIEGQEYEKLIIRVPKEMWSLLKKASFCSSISMNKILVEVLETRIPAIEKKYIRAVDKRK